MNPRSKGSVFLNARVLALSLMFALTGACAGENSLAHQIDASKRRA